MRTGGRLSDYAEDQKQFLQTLAETLPLEEIVYAPNGEPVDILEVTACRSAR